MSEEIKYEPVFGDQSLFDGAPEDAEIVGSQGQWYKTKSGKLYRLTPIQWKEVQVLGHTPLAMRRIIPEPKRWTRADKDAGRSPVYGAILESNGGSRVKFLAENNRGLFLCQYDDGSICAYLPKFFKPIETPAEKAQREEDEWVESAFDAVMIVGVHSTEDIQRIKNHLRTIYRAQLSGELAAPKGG